MKWVEMKNLQFHELFNPVLQALSELGDSGTNQEIHNRVVAILGLTDEQIDEPHKPGQSSTTAVAYRLGWAKTWLKHYGLVENTSRGVWALTQQGRTTKQVDPQEVRAVVQVKLKDRGASADDGDQDDSSTPEHDSSVEHVWRDTLSRALREMDPAAFERLCQRMLRESGFTQVEVTGKSGDGGIDGIGVVRISGFLSFRVLFQCKRYKGTVTAGTVRDFRGAMTGRTDKGLIVTTGRFTRAAQVEAARDGAPEIDLVDGEQLIDKLKELGLGVDTEEVVTERVTVDESFFAGI